MLARVDDWKAYLASGLSSEEVDLLRGYKRTGRLLGSLAFLKRIESKLGRVLRKKNPGRKLKTRKKKVWCPQNIQIIRSLSVQSLLKTEHHRAFYKSPVSTNV
ncbi:MAG: hypothetical protein ACYSTT_09265 [Planctomycetota bacterium]|jgi:hypothetical protein